MWKPCDGCPALENLSNGVVITDVSGAIVHVNAAHCRMSGYAREEVIGQTPRVMKSGRHDAEFYRGMWTALVDRGHWQGEIWDRRKEGELYLKHLTIDAIRDERGDTTHYVGVFNDQSRIEQERAALRRLAFLDPLTGLPNRVLLADRLRQGIARARREGSSTALLFIDLDGFKRVNDGLGHAAGDELLIQVGARLNALLRETDTVARLGGDEFNVLLPGISGADQAASVAARVLEAIERPMMVQEREVSVSASIGVATFPGDAQGEESLLSAADAAMYRAKEAGKGCYRFYSRSIQARAASRMQLEGELRRGIEGGELVMYYQPQVHPESGELLAAEALVRWQHPQNGMVPPNRFIPVAESSGLIVELGAAVLEQVCRQLGAWREAGLEPPRVSVNIAAAQFEDRALIDRVSQLLVDQRLTPADLELEITESSAMHNPDMTIERLMDAQAIGLRVAIDDFGTGYASLSYLRQFPVSALKIDRSFIDGIPGDMNNATLTEALIDLGHRFGLEVVAEGVETAEQLEFLAARSCDVIQGYYFSRPLPAEELAKLLAANHRFLPRAEGEGNA